MTKKRQKQWNERSRVEKAGIIIGILFTLGAIFVWLYLIHVAGGV